MGHLGAPLGALKGLLGNSQGPLKGPLGAPISQGTLRGGAGRSPGHEGWPIPTTSLGPQLLQYSAVQLEMFSGVREQGIGSVRRCAGLNGRTCGRGATSKGQSTVEHGVRGV